MNTFGTRLRTAREVAGLSQDAAALELEITKGAMSAWENDKNYPQLETFMGLCRLYGCSADQLLFGKVKIGEPPPARYDATEYMRVVDQIMALSPRRRRIVMALLEDYGKGD